nr:PREDICTED: exocyst complex component SEC6-like [Musa acuminata subsp. malaccensis]
MEMEYLGIEAKQAAVREVAKILPLQDLLISIASIKADYLSRQQANDAQLSTMLAKQVVYHDIQFSANHYCFLVLFLGKICQAIEDAFMTLEEVFT